MADSKTPLEADGYYHIYNHAVGNEQLFIYDANYLHFCYRSVSQNPIFSARCF